MAKQDPKEIHFIVRDRVNPLRQMQLVVNLEEGSIGVIQNNKMELLNITSSFSTDCGISFIGIDLAKEGSDKTVVQEIDSNIQEGSE